MALQDQLSASWREVLAAEFSKPYWAPLEAFVAAERAAHPGKIYPSEEDTFTALNTVPYDDIKVVLLGQDPYHGPDQAHGLSFSVLPGERVPPSLANMYKELRDDVGFELPKHGYLMSWAEQGVLLLNTVLTVRHKEPNSHSKQGWEKFSDAVIQKIGARAQPVIFLLWGAPARKKASKIDRARHEIIESAHPSPLSAHNGFFGSKPFSQVNAALARMGREPIVWQLPMKV